MSIPLARRPGSAIRIPRGRARGAAALAGTAALGLATRRSRLVTAVDRALDLPRARSEQSRGLWRAVTLLGSRPAAYGAVALRCLASRDTQAASWSRVGPLLVLGCGDAARAVLCRAVARPRPPEHERLTPVHGSSFPSRHTATAFVAIRLVTAGSTGHAAVSLPHLAAAGVGLSRIVLGAHWPTDVIGGWLFGCAWSALAERLCACSTLAERLGACPAPGGAR